MKPHPELRRCEITSPLGQFIVLHSDAGVVGTGWHESFHRTHAHLRRHMGPWTEVRVTSIAGVTDRLSAYFDGQLDALEGISVNAHGTPFQNKVWKELLAIKVSLTCAYKDISERIGHKQSFRAVAGANRANPIPLIIPCHRVIAADGGLGGFSCGLDRKRWLLNHEGARPALLLEAFVARG